jgi:hypothetical protein
MLNWRLKSRFELIVRRILPPILKVAVVRTIEPFVGDDVQSIPLISMGHYIAPGTMGTISGWGIVVSASALPSLRGD